MLGAPRSTSVRHAFTPTLEITAKQVVHDYLDNDKKHAKGKWEANHAAIGLPVPFLYNQDSGTSMGKALDSSHPTNHTKVVILSQYTVKQLSCIYNLNLIK